MVNLFNHVQTSFIIYINQYYRQLKIKLHNLRSIKTFSQCKRKHLYKSVTV